VRPSLDRLPGKGPAYCSSGETKHSCLAPSSSWRAWQVGWIANQFRLGFRGGHGPHPSAPKRKLLRWLIGRNGRLAHLATSAFYCFRKSRFPHISHTHSQASWTLQTYISQTCTSQMWDPRRRISCRRASYIYRCAPRTQACTLRACRCALTYLCRSQCSSSLAWPLPASSTCANADRRPSSKRTSDG